MDSTSKPPSHWQEDRAHRLFLWRGVVMRRVRESCGCHINDCRRWRIAIKDCHGRLPPVAIRRHIKGRRHLGQHQFQNNRYSIHTIARVPIPINRSIGRTINHARRNQQQAVRPRCLLPRPVRPHDRGGTPSVVTVIRPISPGRSRLPSDDCYHHFLHSSSSVHVPSSRIVNALTGAGTGGPPGVCPASHATQRTQDVFRDVWKSDALGRDAVERPARLGICPATPEEKKSRISTFLFTSGRCTKIKL